MQFKHLEMRQKVKRLIKQNRGRMSSIITGLDILSILSHDMMRPCGWI